jgi:hypothetical protein
MEGPLADKASQLLLAGLGRAAAEPAGLPLHARKGAKGLFAGTAAGKLAAQRSKDEGYLQIVGTETRGKSALEICALTDKGLAHLLSQVSPKQVLEDFIRAVESRQAQLNELVGAARQMQTGLDTLKLAAENVLRQVHAPVTAPSINGTHAANLDLLPLLVRWQESGAAEDCPLPELFRQACVAAPHLTVGSFHDALRRLHDQQQIYLHPWTGPLYAIPEPPFALLVGHEIAYYASARR